MALPHTNKALERLYRFEGIADRFPKRCGRWAVHRLEHPTNDVLVWLMCSWALLRWERIEAAERALTNAQLCLAPTDVQLHLYYQRLTLMLRQLGGEGLTLQDKWESLIQLCQRYGARRELARAACEQIAHLLLFNRIIEARQLAKDYASPIQHYGLPQDKARYMHLQGVAAITQDSAVAQQHLDRASQEFVLLRHPTEQARVQFEQCWLHITREQFDDAETSLRHALQIYIRLDMPYRIALCYRDLGDIARYRGNHAEALKLGYTAQHQFLELHRPERAAGCEFNIAAVAYASGLFELALGMYRHAEVAFTQVGDQYHACVALRNQVLVLTALQRYDEAIKVSDVVACQDAHQQRPLSIGELQTIRARAFYGLQRYEQAIREIEAAYLTFSAYGNQPAASECLLDKGWFLLELQQYSHAQPFLAEAEANLRNRPVHHWRACYGLGRVLQQQGNEEQAMAYYVKSCIIIANLRKQLRIEHASSRIFTMAQQLYRDAIQLAIKQSAIDQVINLTEQQRALVLDSQRHLNSQGLGQPISATPDATLRTFNQRLRQHTTSEELQQTIEAMIGYLLRKRHNTVHPQVDTYLRDTPYNLENTRQQLCAQYGEDWTILYPLVFDTYIVLIGITATALLLEQYAIDSDFRSQLAAACHPSRRWHTYRDFAHMQDPTVQPWNTLRSLAQHLLPQWLVERLHSTHRLIIIPHSILHMLPWATLYLESGWLCEQAIIELVPSLHMVGRTEEINTHGNALLLGCSHFNDRAPELQLTHTLVEEVAYLWEGSTYKLLEQQATCEEIYRLHEQAQLTRFNLIHIASHAQLGHADGLLAHIALADDDLLIEDILQLRLNADLVILAVCEGGATMALLGEEVLGLTQALLGAGAKSVLSSLWTIYDESVLPLFRTFYQMLSTGYDPATALAYTQRKVLHDKTVNGNVLLQSPFIWGGFVVTSCGRPALIS